MKNLKITAKMFVSFGIIFVMILILGIVSFFSITKLNHNAERYADISIPAVDDVWIARQSLVTIQRDLLQMVATVDLQDFNNSQDHITKVRSELMTALDNLEELMPNFKQQGEEVRGLIDNAATYRQQIVDYAGLLSTEGNLKAYEVYSKQYSPEFDKAVAGLEQLYKDILQDVEMQIAESDQTVSASMFTTFAMLAVALFFTIAGTIVMTRSIMLPVKEIEAVANEMAQGKLGRVIQYQSRDELGDLAHSIREAMGMMKGYVDDITYAMGEFANNSFVLRPPTKPFIGDFKPIEDSVVKVAKDMSDTLSQIREAADQVNSGSEQVSSGAQALAQGATEQASSIEELSASINEISTQVKQNADHALHANEKAVDATDAITASNEQMQKLMAAMDDINVKSTEISKIIKTIEDIAFQTNILALNAAVEAARAGAAGKGFAVVADEVRNLAGKSAEAAKNTTELIEDSVSSIGEGVRLAEATAKDLLGAVDSVRETTTLITGITQASNDQAASISQVTIGVDQIASVVQTNSATSEESAAASEELSSQANLLKQLVAKFKLQETSFSMGNRFADTMQQVEPITSYGANDFGGYSGQKY